MALRFLHAADLHLDTPFTARGRYPSHVTSVLRDASLTAFERLVESAIVHQVAFVVFAGDVYDGAERGVRAQMSFRDGLARLSEAGIRSFVAHGNHDPVEEGWSAIDAFADGVTVFGAGEVQSVPFEVGGEPVTVHGISYGISKVTENLSLRFAPPTTPGLHVGVLHANVGHDTGHHPYSPCTIEDLLAAGMDYWALGHIHRRQVLHRDPWVVYPGNLQGRSVKASESGAKGALLVDVADGRVSEPALLAFDVVRFDGVTVDVSDLDLDGVEQALLAAGAAAAEAADGRSLLLSATLVGRGAVNERLRSPERADELLHHLRDAAGSRTPFLWWDSLSVKTDSVADVAALVAEDRFAADLLATASELGSRWGADGADDPRVAWTAGMAADLLRMAGADEPVGDVAELWDDAVALALDLLVREER